MWPEKLMSRINQINATNNMVREVKWKNVRNLQAHGRSMQVSMQLHQTYLVNMKEVNETIETSLVS
jgi:hypothetical protein